MTKQKAYLFVLFGAFLWGIIGIFIKQLYAFHFSPWEVVAIRVIVSAFIMVILLILFRPQLLKINWKDSVYFIGTGIVSIVFFNWCYFYVMEQASISLAVILLYTGPAFVTILARLLFKEYFTRYKIIALILTTVGCAFVVGILPNFHFKLTAAIVFIGLSSGFFYALYSIFAKFITEKYSSLTITTYSFIAASLFMVPFGNLHKKITLFYNWDVLVNILGLSIFSTCLAYLFYTYGLMFIESSRASILSTIEPAVAVLIGVFLYKESLTFYQLIGMLLILLSILFVVKNQKNASLS